MGDFERESSWTSELTRNGSENSYSETLHYTYSIVTEYVDADGVESTLTQTGTTTDVFYLETYVDPLTSASSIRTSTAHSESDAYDFAQSWTTTVVDSETGDVVVTSMSFNADGSQAFSILTTDPDLGAIGYSASQAESASLAASLSSTSASGLSSATTSLLINGSFNWSMSAARWQQAGVTTANNNWMTGPIDPQLEFAEEYEYLTSGESSSTLSHTALGAEIINRTSLVTPEGGGTPVEVELTIESDVDFEYSLTTNDEFEFSLSGADPIVGATTAEYDYEDIGWLEETLVDDSAVSVTSESEAGIVTLVTNNDVEQETRWDYDTNSSGSTASGVYVFNLDGETTGSSDVYTSLGITIYEEEKTSSTGVSSHVTSTIVNDEFAYLATASSTPLSASAGTEFTADQETHWTASEVSSYSVVDETDPEKKLTFLASSSTDYTDGVDTLVVGNSMAMSAAVSIDGEGTLTVISDYSSQYDSSADWTGESSDSFQLEEEARNLELSEGSTTVDEDGIFQSSSHQSGSSLLVVTAEQFDADDDGLIEPGEYSAAVSYEQTDEFQITVQSGSHQNNQETTLLWINHDTSEAGRDVYLRSLSIYEEEVDVGSNSGLSGEGTLTVTDLQTTTDGWTPPEPVDANEDGIPDDPPPSETAVISYVGESNAQSTVNSEGHYVQTTTVDYDDIDNRDPANTARIQSHSEYTEGAPSAADPLGGDVRFSSSSSLQIEFLEDGTIRAAVNSTDSQSQSGDYETEETLTVDTFFSSLWEESEPLPKEGRGAVGAQPLEVSYAMLHSSQRPSGTQVLRNDVAGSPMSSDTRATHTETTYSDNGRLESSSESESASVTIAVPNPTPDPEDEDSAWIYTTSSGATEDSEYSDEKFDFDYLSVTQGSIIQFGSDSSREMGTVAYPLTGSPSPPSSGDPTPTPVTPAGVPMSITVPVGVYVISRSDFRDEYHENGVESLSATATAEAGSTSAGGDFSFSASTTLYNREADVDGRTDRTGGAKGAGSSAVEESIGSNSVSVQAFTHSNLGGSSSYAVGSSSGSIMPGGGHVFGFGDLPDAYAMEDTIVQTSSTMNSIGFNQSAGSENDITSSAHADYRSNVTENVYTRDMGETWAYEDTNGDLGSPHRYQLTINNQSGAAVSRFVQGTASLNQNAAYTSGIDRTATSGRTIHGDLEWLHHDTAIGDDGEFTRTVHDSRSTDHGQSTTFARSGGPGHDSLSGTISHTGRATADIVTTWTGGYLTGAWQQPGRVVTDPDSVTQHVTTEGESHVDHDVVAQSDNGGPNGAILDRDSLSAFEYTVTYERPEPPEGWPEEEEWYPEDDGLTFTVVDYERTATEYGLNTDDSPEALANWYSELSREWNRLTTDTYTGNNEYSSTMTLTTTVTPFIWTGDPAYTMSDTMTSPGGFPDPGLNSEPFGLTFTDHDYAGWMLSAHVTEDGTAAAPVLASTFANTLVPPVAAVVNGQEPHAREQAQQPNTEVEKNVPGTAVQPALPKDNCGCSSLKFDRTNDPVGRIIGDMVYRDGFVEPRPLSEVETFDTLEDNPTPADWDAFFDNRGGLELNLKVDIDARRRLPLAGTIAPLSEEVLQLKERLSLEDKERRIRAAIEKVEREFEAEQLFKQRVRMNTFPEDVPFQHIDLIWGGTTAAGSFVPLVGEALDVATFFDPEATSFDFLMSGLSLTANFFTAGLAPNWGGVRGAVNAAGDSIAAVKSPFIQGSRALGNATEGASDAMCRTDMGMAGLLGGCFAAGTLVRLCEAPALAGMATPGLERSALNHANDSITVDRLIAIEDVPLGARVPEYNPRPSDQDYSLGHVDPATWLEVRVAILRSDGSEIDVHLLRPRSWTVALNLHVGTEFTLHLSDVAVKGLAIVTYIGPCCDIQGGLGNVVTGRFVTRAATNLLSITLESGTQIEATTNHLVWLPIESSWVRADELKPGDLLDGCDDYIAVESIRSAPAADVFNIEVHEHHVYRVSNDLVLVHNNSALNSHEAGKTFIEDVTRMRAYNEYNLKLKHTPGRRADYVDRLGNTYDHMGFKSMIPFWPSTKAKFFAQVYRHLGKADNIIIDLTGFPQHIKDEVADFVLRLPIQEFNRILPIGF